MAFPSNTTSRSTATVVKLFVLTSCNHRSKHPTSANLQETVPVDIPHIPQEIWELALREVTAMASDPLDRPQELSSIDFSPASDPHANFMASLRNKINPSLVNKGWNAIAAASSSSSCGFAKHHRLSLWLSDPYSKLSETNTFEAVVYSLFTHSDTRLRVMRPHRPTNHFGSLSPPHHLFRPPFYPTESFQRVSDPTRAPQDPPPLPDEL